MTRVLACGAFLKNTACLFDTATPQAPLWSGVHGDLSDPAACAALEHSEQAQGPGGCGGEGKEWRPKVGGYIGESSSNGEVKSA